MTWFEDFRDWLLNHLAVWCMNHCYNWAMCFSTACKQMTTLELEMTVQDIIQARKKLE